MDNRYLWIVLLIGIFALSFGYSYFDKDENLMQSYVYVGDLDEYYFEVSDQGDHFLNWSITYNLGGGIYQMKPYTTPYPYGPMELLDIEMYQFRKLFQETNQVYITRDVYLDEKTDSEIVVSLLSIDRLVDKFKDGALLAAIEENELSRQLHLPVITCDDSNDGRMVIWLKEGSENKIYKENDYCIVGEFLEGDDPNKVATKIAYHIIGVM
jgi:hypothetical protein